MRLTRLAAIAFALVFCTHIANSQTAAPAATPEISAEKKALIREFLDLTNSRTSSEAMFKAQFEQMERDIPEYQWQSISSMDEFKRLTSAQQQEVRTKSQESSARMVNRIKELFLARIDMAKIVEDLSYPIYDKHFTEAELRDLVTFYRSETGKKIVAEMPSVISESMGKIGQMIEPRVKEIVEEAQKSQADELNKEIEKMIKAQPKPPAKKPTSKRRP
jgi:hypothetical protein